MALTRRALLAAGVVLTLLVLAPNLADATGPRPGTLDLSYGHDGVTMAAEGRITSISSVATQPDGKTVGVGVLGDPVCCNIGVFRFLADGSFDPTFGGGDGVTEIDIAPGVWDVGYDIAVAPDGKIVVSGGFGEVNVSRLLADGSLDPTFGIGGSISSRYGIRGGVGASGHDLAVLPDGRVVVAMQSYGDTEGFVVLRLTASGFLDPSFGVGGISFTPVLVPEGRPPHQIFPTGLVVDPLGRVLVLSGAQHDVYVIRLTPAGTLDRTFGFAGFGIVALGAASDLAITASGALLVSGATATDSFLVVRLTADGWIDLSFGVRGAARLAAPGPVALSATALAVQPDGRFVVAGYSGVGHVAVARFLASGRPDLTFGTSGSTITPLGLLYTSPQGLALQPDGGIVIGGVALTSRAGYDRAFVARYLGG